MWYANVMKGHCIRTHSHAQPGCLETLNSCLPVTSPSLSRPSLQIKTSHAPFERHRTSPARTAVTAPAVRGHARASAYVTDSFTKGQVKAKDTANVASQTGSPQGMRDSHPHKHSLKAPPLRKNISFPTPTQPFSPD